MKTKAAADEDEAEPKKIRSSRSKHRSRRRSHSSSDSESPPLKRSKKHSKRIADSKKKSKRSKATSSRRRHRSLSPSRSLSASSPASVARHSCSTCSSSASERSVSPLPRTRSRDVRPKKGRGRDRERDRKRRKARRSTSSTSTSASSDSSRSRSRKRKAGGTNGGAARGKIGKDYSSRHASRSEKSVDEDAHTDEEALAAIAEKKEDDIRGNKKNLELEKVESPPSKEADDTENVLPVGGANSDAEDLELILRQKALENFRKFRAGAIMAGKIDTAATVKQALADSPQNTGTKTAQARSAAVTHLQRQGSRLEEDGGNATSYPSNLESSAGMSHGAGSHGTLEAGDTGVPTQQKGRMVEATHSTSHFRLPQDVRNSRSVMQRLRSAAVVNHVNGAPRVRSVVSIPAREGLDGSTCNTSPRLCENSAPVGSSSDVGPPPLDINKAEGTNEDDRKTSEASAVNDSILSPDEGKSQARTEDKDGSQFQKKTFSRMHDGESVEVSYKVYIPKKNPALARRKLQR